MSFYPRIIVLEMGRFQAVVAFLAWLSLLRMENPPPDAAIRAFVATALK